jgi:hypothetical protein
VLFFYKDDKPKGFKLLNNIKKQAKFYLVCLIEIKLFGHTHYFACIARLKFMPSNGKNNEQIFYEQALNAFFRLKQIKFLCRFDAVGEGEIQNA